MERIIQCLLLGVIGGIGFAMTAEAGEGDLSAYLVGKEGSKHLKEPLTLREEQGGIAGITGTSRVIEPDGKWRVDEFRVLDGKEEATTIKTGRLSSGEMVALAKDLAAQDLMGLAETVGTEEPVNAHKVIFQFGKRRSTVAAIVPRSQGHETTKAMIMKTAEDRGTPDDKLMTRCANIAHAIESRVALKKPSED